MITAKKVCRYRIKSSSGDIRPLYFVATREEALAKFDKDFCQMFYDGFILTRMVRLRKRKYRHMKVAEKKSDLCGCLRNRPVIVR